MAARKRARTSLDTATVDVWKREVGGVSNRNFARRLAASEDLVLRFDLLHKLDKHRGCVNTISFNQAGDILVSGSDDRRIILWNWEAGEVKVSFHSGHNNNVFQAKIMPYTDDQSIVTCAADGQVRHAQILQSGPDSKLLTKHRGRVHKLAVEPGSPHIFYTCGEDGVVKHIDLRSGNATNLFTCKSLPGDFISTVHLNAIAIDPRNPNLFAVGGSDQFARLFDIRQYKWDGSSKFDQPVDCFCPPHLIDDEHVGITGLAFSEQSELLVSYNDEFIYLFTKDIGLGPDPTLTSQVFNDVNDAGDTSSDNHSGVSHDNVKATPQAYKGHRNCETVKGVNFFGPKSEYVVSGSDCGRIFVWKKRNGELVRVMEADKHVVNCIESHPHAPVLASSGIEHDIKIWTPKAIDKAIVPSNIQKDRVRVPNLIHHFGFYPFGGFYNDDDDFTDSDTDDNYGDDDDDDDTDDDDDSNDDDDSGGDGGGIGDCDNHENTTDYEDDCSENESLNEEQLEEEDNGGDERPDSIFLGETDDYIDFGSETFYDDDMEDIIESENAVSDDSFVDISDNDDCSDSE